MIIKAGLLVATLCVTGALSYVMDNSDPGEDAVASVYNNYGEPVFMQNSIKYLVGDADADIQMFNMYDWERGIKCTVVVSKPTFLAQRCAQFYVGE